MQVAEGMAPVLEIQVRPAHQDVEHAAVVEAHLEVIVLIQLKEVDGIRELITDLLEVRTAQKLEAVGIVIALCEINGHRRFGQLLLLIIHQDARIEGLHVDLFGVLDLDGLFGQRPSGKCSGDS